ncbi:DUF6934 family protein [Dyadobacter sp.]|uniref:DUF6934 family protein n=1 Tax=Dyadobacter sp. TaxID=1914288 RepID=UPI003F725D07
MNIDRYAIYELSKTEYRFFSEGRNGCFEMRICFESIGEHLYNLAFGLWDKNRRTIDDHTELHNGDMDIILATVAAQSIDFLDANKQASIYATGLTQPGKLAVRTRKYQIGINKHLSYLTERHNVYGFRVLEDAHPGLVGGWPFGRSGRWELFQPNTNYGAFLLNLK